MLNTEPMQKVRIICLTNSKYNVVAGLHKLGIVDLRKSELEIGDDAPTENYTRLSEMMIKVQGALDIVGKNVAKPGKLIGQDRIEGRFGELESRMQKVYALRDEIRALAEDNKILDNAESVAKWFGDLKVDLGNLNSGVLSFAAVLVDDKQLAKVTEHPRKFKRNAEVLTNRAGKNRNLVFAAYKKGDEAVEEMLKGLKGEELDLKAKYLDSTPQSIIKSVAERKAENLAKTEKAKRDLATIGENNYSAFAVLRESLSVEMARAEVSSTFKKTEKTFAIEGWIPKKNTGELRALLHKVTGNKFVVEEMKTNELAPTLVNRPAFLKPFDYVMEFFSLPRSDEIDPTWIFSTPFPIFYGLMVSDVGYGVASFILSQIIIMKTDPDGLMCNAAKIWRISAIPVIIFGVITNQYFGLPLNHLFTSWTGVSWIGDVTWIVVLTVIFGIVQVSLGLLLGAVNESHHGHKKLAVSKLTSIVVVIAGTIAIAGMIFHVFPPGLSMDAVVITIVALVATIVLAGIEATEITNLITHTLSYSRIMGFGLGSIILASLIDQAFTPHLGPGIGGVLLFVAYGAIFLTLHVMNMIVSIFEGIVQGARLNFVEFFSKFYKGAGVKYRPFAYRRIYTEE